MRGRTLVHIDPFEHVDLLWDLVRIEGVEGSFMRLEFGQIVPIHHPIFFYALKDNDSATAVTHGQKLTLLVERDRGKNVLLRDV